MTQSTDIVLVKVDQARVLLSEARTASEAKQIMDMAKAAEIYGRRQKASDEAIGFAREISVEAQRLLGEFLESAPKNKGANGSEVTGSRRAPVKDKSPTLASSGISKKESSDAQLVARVARSTPPVYRDYKLGKASLSAVRKLAKNADRRAASTSTSRVSRSGIVSDLSDLAGQKFACIYADPPWRYGNQGTRAATNNHYATLSVDQICALPIGELAADKAHLHLWTTNGFLFECPKIFAAWGFEFKSSFVWVKTQMGIGNYWRNAHELLLLAVHDAGKDKVREYCAKWSEWAEAQPKPLPK